MTLPAGRTRFLAGLCARRHSRHQQVFLFTGSRARLYTRSPGLIASCLVLTAAGVLNTGCVRRTVTINTQPQGATVTLNDDVIGTSPVSTEFLWYGKYDVIVRKEGYETLKTSRCIAAPWYQVPGIDFITEILLPLQFHDRRQMSFDLEPTAQINTEELIENAKRARDEAVYGAE